MQLSQHDVNKDRALWKKAKALYMSAFPKYERVPWWILCLNAHRKNVDVTAWMDGEQFCGLTVSVTVEGMHFLMFFAVEESLRGKGCGSAILTELRNTHPSVSLNIELLEEDAPNYQQRLDRFRFYGKNGFYNTGWHVWEIGGEFLVLSTRQELDVTAYKKIFKRFSFGLWDVKLKKEET